VITTAQLAQVGLDRRAVSKRVQAGRLHPLYRGVYAVGHDRLSQESRWMAAVLAAGKGAALSHLAAAKHWQIWSRRAQTIDVIVAGNRRARTGFTAHRARTLDPRDVTVHQGIPTTTPARTLVDLATTLTAPQLTNVIHEAVYRHRFDEAATREAAGRARGRDLRVLHTALQAHASGSAGTRSDAEDQFLAQWQGAEPRVNTKLHGIEVDLHWPEHNLVVEIDGPGHQRPRTRREDASRDARLREAGVTVLRIPSGQG
jgi:hypothetical protein